MNKPTGMACATLLLCASGALRAADGFAGVQCGSDVPKALLGRTMPNERVAALEERHKDLGLKDLGGSEVSDDVFLASWRICGKEYQLLEEKDVVRDVLAFPPHSKDAPAFIGSCKANAKAVPGTIVAVLQGNEGKDDLPATAAWRIDEAGKRFVKVPTEGLLCARDGVITADGGR